MTDYGSNRRQPNSRGVLRICAATQSRPPTLELSGIGFSFGGAPILSGVNLIVAQGERRVILGPNGAGKTTLFNVVCGDYSPRAGSIRFLGRDITDLKQHMRARIGIARTYQNSLLFDGLTVLDNIFLAIRGIKRGRFSLLRPRANDSDLARAREIADRVRIRHQLDTDVRDLSHGQRRQLELGMALAAEPKLLMLDEPAAGLSPGDRPELLRTLHELPRSLTLVVVEHDMDIALPIADIVTVMKDGAIVVERTPDKVERDPTVQAIYLGEAA
ncbi:ABC transporter ATP-binding protein [Nitrobacter winogradskyi]|uniref:ABC transporter ATP-binding protein n=1 Tax=Nitrobacter winogradskyi TaxID=913 RepID=UPI00114461BC|nr:ABC transporter ATP-binding protein [Nitrobacter winogradskyi]